MRVHRVKQFLTHKRSVYTPVKAGTMCTRSNHWVKDELPT